MAFWRATDVDLPNNSTIVTVNTGDDVGEMTTGYILQINSGQFLEVKNVNTGASPQTIELYQLYTGSAITGGSAISAPTQGAIKEATEEVRLLRQSYEGLADSVSTTNTASSLAKRDGSGRLEATAGDSGNDVVVMSQTGTSLGSDITTSSTDATSGRLLKVGDFGLGTTTQTYLSDCDVIVNSGFYSINNGATGQPISDTGLLIHNTHNNTTGSLRHSQIYISKSNQRMFHRISDGGVWLDWQESLTDSNTNLNSILVTAAGQTMLIGVAYSTTKLYLTKSINNVTRPTSIILSGSGDFDIYTLDGTLIKTGTTPVYSANTSTNELVIVITESAGPFTVGQTYKVVSKSSSSSIEWN